MALSSNGQPIDLLFDVRNSYYIGAYQQCINTAQNLKLKLDADIHAKDSFLYRSYIALNKPSIPLSEIADSESASHLKSIRRFAEYMAHSNKREQIAQQVLSELEHGNFNDIGIKCSSDDEVALLMNSSILLQEEKVEDALRILYKAPLLGNGLETTGTISTKRPHLWLECRAAIVQCLLKMNRPVLASKMLKEMQELDEDCTLTQLAQAWNNLTIGKDKLKDAFYTYQELIDKHGPTPTLLVSQSACLIQQQKYSDAEKLLQDALQRDSSNPETLISLAVVSQFLGKPVEMTNRYVNQMKQDFAGHGWTRQLLAKEEEFDRMAAASRQNLAIPASGFQIG